MSGMIAQADERKLMDEQSRIFLESFNSLGLPSMETLTVEQARAIVEAKTYSSNAPLTSVLEIAIPSDGHSIPARVYIPQGEGPFPVFVTYHGGGWIFGSLNVHDPLCREIASQAGVVVVSVAYRLAPEHKFPAPLQDCYTAALWVKENIHLHKGDASRLSVGGDSAGGNLSAAVALMGRDNNTLQFRCQVLIYPVTDCNFDTDSYRKYEEGYFLTLNQMKWFWSLYLQDEKDAANPYASPLRAADFRNLPPTLVVVAKYDPLHDEGIAYGKKLQEAGTSVKTLSYNSMHVFIGFANNLEIGRTAISDIASYLHSSLY